MNELEKAKELVWNMDEASGEDSIRIAKQCALVAVDEILKQADSLSISYWKNVKIEIKAL